MFPRPRPGTICVHSGQHWNCFAGRFESTPEIWVRAAMDILERHGVILILRPANQGDYPVGPDCKMSGQCPVQRPKMVAHCTLLRGPRLSYLWLHLRVKQSTKKDANSLQTYSKLCEVTGADVADFLHSCDLESRSRVNRLASKCRVQEYLSSDQVSTKSVR